MCGVWRDFCGALDELFRGYSRQSHVKRFLMLLKYFRALNTSKAGSLHLQKFALRLWVVGLPGRRAPNTDPKNKSPKWNTIPQTEHGNWHVRQGSCVVKATFQDAPFE